MSPDTALRIMEEIEKEDRELPDGTEGDETEGGGTGVNGTHNTS